MKLPVFLIVGLVAFALSGSPAAPVPERAVGIWSTTDCGKGGLTLLVNAHIALVVEGEGLKIRVAIVPAEWVGGSIMLRVQGEAHERVLHLDDLKRCDALPGAMSLLFDDLVAVFSELDDVMALCRKAGDITASCVAVVTDLIDITGDGTFSRAELRQAMRAASFFIAYRGVAAQQREAFVSLDKLLIARLATSVLGPFVVTRLIDSYDADGDASVSPEELLQGRSPEQAVQGILADLVANAPPAAVALLMRSIPGFQPLVEGD